MDWHTSPHTPDPAESEWDIRLVKDAMDRGTDTLEPPADLVRGVLVIGHRKRVRARLALMGAGLAVAAVAVGGFLVLAPGGVTASGPAGPVSASPTASAQGRAPIEVVSRPSPSASGSRSPSRSPEEQSRSDDYRRRVAEALRDLLPATIGRVRIIEGESTVFESITAEGRIFPLTFSVKRAAGATTERTCLPTESSTQCLTGQLPGAVPIVVRLTSRDGGTATSVDASFHLGDSNVILAVGADEPTDTSAPVDGQQLLTFARDPRVLQLVREADRRPSATSTTSVSPTSTAG
jgi:hypothetical protein